MHRRLIAEARPHAGWLALSLGLGFTGGALAILQARWISALLSAAFEHVDQQAQGLQQLFPALLSLLVLFLLRAALFWGSETAAGRLAAGVLSRLRSRLLERLFAAGPLALRQEASGEIAHTLGEGIDALEPYYAQYLPQIALSTLLPLVMLAAVFPLDPLSGLILLLTGPLIPLFLWLVGSAGQALTRRQYLALSRMSAYFLDVLQGLTTLKMLGRSQAQLETIWRTGERFRQVTMEVLRVTFLSALVLEWLATLSTAVIAVQVGLRLLYGEMDFSTAFTVLLLAPEFYQPLRQFGLRYHAGQSGVAAAGRIYALSDSLPPVSRLPAQGAAAPASAPALSVEGVSFSYPDGRQGLQQVTVHFPAGTVTALVGASGSGKSTLTALLLGLASPAEGRILADGQDLALISPQAWRALAAWVPQQPYLLNDSAAANIALARPLAGRDEIRRAAILAGADELIQALPHGYDTPIGEGGARLSSGQAQRLALARAFLKDASLLVLDEPSAYLDAASEAALTAALQRLVVGRTVVVIAHRLRTVRLASQVVVLSGGRVVQRGSPQELVAQPGLFAELSAASELYASPGSSAAVYPQPPAETASPLPPAGNSLQQPSPGAAQALRFLTGLLRPYWKGVLLSAALGFSAVASSAGLLGAAAYLIARAAQQPSIAELQVAIVAVRFFGLGRGVFRYLERLASHRVTFSLLAELRLQVYAALEPLAPAGLLYRRAGDLLQRCIGDIQTLENFYVRAAAPVLTAFFAALAAAAFFGWQELSLGLSLSALMAASGLGLPVLAWRVGRGASRQLVRQQAALKSRLVESMQGMADLIVFGRAPDFLKHTVSASEDLSCTQARLSAYTALFSACAGLLAHLGLWTALALAIQSAEAGRLPPVAIGALALVAWSSFEAVSALPTAAQHLAGDLEAGQRLLEIGAGQRAPAPAVPHFPLPDSFELQVSGVYFAYPPSPGAVQPQPWALQNISFRLAPGQHLALVGPSGAGKSTLLHLLLGLYTPQAGQITLGGCDLQSLDAKALRQALAVAPARAYIFNATLADNIRLSQPEASQPEIEAAARLAGIHDWIAALPEGYQTWTGEGGVRLSAGERQRLSLARALLRCSSVRRSPLLLLDEPTAGLDAASAAAFWRRLRELRRTSANPPAILSVTHQLASPEDADEMIALENGRIREHGAYAALAAQGGAFAWLPGFFQDS